MSNQWFRMYAEFANDPKVQMLSEANQRRLVMIFCIRCNGDVTLHDDEIAFQLRISSDEWAKTKALFVAKNFINENNEVLNWDKRQFISDTSAARVRRYREKQKNNDVTLCNVTVTAPDTDTDTEYSSGTNVPSLASNDFENRSTLPDKPKPKSQKINFSFEEKRFEHIEPEHWQAWQAAYPAIDVQTCVLRAAAWLLANPNNRKQNYQKFITNWLAREQDKAPRVANGRHPPPAPQRRGYDFDVIEEQINERRRKRDLYQGLSEGAVGQFYPSAARPVDVCKSLDFSPIDP